MRKNTAIIAFAMVTGSLQAAEYHVSPSGQDANAGSAKQPLLTIQAAEAKVLAKRLAEAVISFGAQ